MSLSEWNSRRFCDPIGSCELKKAAKGVIPKNTEISTQWAVRNFNAWATNRSIMEPTDIVPSDFFTVPRRRPGL